MATKKVSKAPAKTNPPAPAPKAAPKAKAKKALEGCTVTFVHPGNRTMALVNAKAACEKLGAEIGDTKIPRYLLSTTRLNNVYGPDLELAEVVVKACSGHLHGLSATLGKDPNEQGLFVFID